MLRGRYAPSPSGPLHLGNLRTALLAWLFARSQGGGFTLRVEDLDRPRTRSGAADAILGDLRWLGLDWDEGPDTGGPLGPYIQSARIDLYRHALAQLRAKDLVYPCYCTRAELQQVASAPHPGEPSHRYPGTCRNLTTHQRQTLEASGRRAAWRFRAPSQAISFDDLVQGRQSDNVAQSMGDFIVMRSDGIVAYQLAVVVDDALMGINQIVRGADLLSSTARQLALYDALGFPRPQEYAHVPLALGPTGTRMAKRDASAGIDELRARGETREHVLSALASSCGLAEAGQHVTLAQLTDHFVPSRLSRSNSSIAL